MMPLKDIRITILKPVFAFAEFLGSETTFYQISTKDPVIKFLDMKIKCASDVMSRIVFT